MDELTGKTQADARGASPAAPATPADLKRMVGRTDDVPRGIVLMIVATILFAGASAASKWLVGIYPVGETLFIRSLASLITGAAVCSNHVAKERHRGIPDRFHQEDPIAASRSRMACQIPTRPNIKSSASLFI